MLRNAVYSTRGGKQCVSDLGKPQGRTISRVAKFRLKPITGHHVLYTNPSLPTHPVPLGKLVLPGITHRFFHKLSTRVTCATRSTGETWGVSDWFASGSQSSFASLDSSIVCFDVSLDASIARFDRPASSSNPFLPNTLAALRRLAFVETILKSNSARQFPVKTASSSMYHAKSYVLLVPASQFAKRKGVPPLPEAQSHRRREGKCGFSAG